MDPHAPRVVGTDYSSPPPLALGSGSKPIRLAARALIEAITAALGKSSDRGGLKAAFGAVLGLDASAAESTIMRKSVLKLQGLIRDYGEDSLVEHAHRADNIAARDSLAKIGVVATAVVTQGSGRLQGQRMTQSKAIGAQRVTMVLDGGHMYRAPKRVGEYCGANGRLPCGSQVPTTSTSFIEPHIQRMRNPRDRFRKK